jgi:biotin carboxylase
MSVDLKEKKLLILGGNPETIPLIETSKSLGVYTVVTDFNPNAPAKKYADKAYDVDGLDINGLIDLCKIENIDGIMVGVADRLISPYFEVCNLMGFPCYVSEEQSFFFTNKHKFNELCLSFEIHTIPNYNEQFLNKNLEEIPFPVFVKPTDANSGKGMSICHNISELFKAVEKARSFSKSDQYLIEKYMQCDDMFIYYTFKDGHVFVSAIADRFTTDQQGDLSRVCVRANYPSKYINLYFETLHPKMIELFNEMKVKNGVFMISAFVDNNKIHLYDPGFRLQGEAPNIPVQAICGFDHKEMLVNFALTGSMGDINLNFLNDPTFKNKFATTIWLLAKEGEISKIMGLEEVKNDPNLIIIAQRLFEGAQITKEMIGTEAQVFARLYLQFDTKYNQNQASIYNHLIKVFDQNGNLMLLN